MKKVIRAASAMFAFGDAWVDAVDMHRQLRSKKPYDLWLEEQITGGLFEIRKDYDAISTSWKGPHGKSVRRTTHYFSQDAAKHIAMMDLGDVGALVRQFYASTSLDGEVPPIFEDEKIRAQEAEASAGRLASAATLEKPTSEIASRQGKSNISEIFGLCAPLKGQRKLPS